MISLGTVAPRSCINRQGHCRTFQARHRQTRKHAAVRLCESIFLHELSRELTTDAENNDLRKIELLCVIHLHHTP